MVLPALAIPKPTLLAQLRTYALHIHTDTIHVNPDINTEPCFNQQKRRASFRLYPARVKTDVINISHGSNAGKRRHLP